MRARYADPSTRPSAPLSHDGVQIARIARRFALAWVAIVLILVAADALVPQRSGPLALVEILEPFLVLSGLLLAPICLTGRSRAGAAVVVVLIVAIALRDGPGLVTLPNSAIKANVTVTEWNVEAGDNGGQRVIDGLASVSSDLVGLEELQPAMADALATDPTIAASYPYRSLAPDSSVYGVGLMSRFPILSATYSRAESARSATAPPFIRALVKIPNAPPTVVYVVHPLPATFQTFFHIPFAVDTTLRDAGIATIRAAIDADLAAGLTVLAMGDINTTPREPAYAQLSAGLQDARDAGMWPGLTWRWDPFKALPFGLLRIDYVFSTALPVSYDVRCTDLSDHCQVTAGLSFPVSLL